MSRADLAIRSLVRAEIAERPAEVGADGVAYTRLAQIDRR